MAAPPRTYGEIFTRRWVVDTILDLVHYAPEDDLGARRILEPACGTGAFLGPIVERLLRSAAIHGRDPATLADAIRAYDLRPENVEVSRALCANLLGQSGVPEDQAARLAHTWVQTADFLLLPILEPGPSDYAVGNPPYIRYDDLDPDVAAKYRRAWPTMRGRGDIYVGFIERCLRNLRPGGRLGFICADRWMRNNYGAGLRKLVAGDYAVEAVWTMHDVDAFENEVSAYPAITVIAAAPQGRAVVADTTTEFGPGSAAALTKWTLADDDTTVFEDVGVRAHRLDGWFRGEDMWPTGSPARVALIEHLGYLPPLEDPTTGTRVSIGIATGADKVYVTRDPDLVEPDRLLPLAMRRDLMTGYFSWGGNYLVNPWREDGSLVDLADCPRLAAYLTGHPELRKRHVAKKSPASWYRTIDKVNASIINRPKLLLQDMKTTIHPVLEPGGHYPHHNLYYIVSDSWDMEVLGGLLLSRIAQAFIEAFCVRMRGGTLRFQAQYLRKIRVPAQESIPGDVAEALRQAFRARDVDAATQAAAEAYGISPTEFDLV